MSDDLNPSMTVNWTPGMTLDEMEKQCILAAFRFYRGNKTQTAGALKIAIRTLDNKLEKYEADRQSEIQRYNTDKARDAELLARMRGFPQPDANFTLRMAAEKAERERAASILETVTRVRVQPTVETRPEHAMSVSQPGQIQTVLPRQAVQSGNNKRR